MINVAVLLGILVVGFIFVEDAYFRPTESVKATLKEVDFSYSSENGLSYEKALSISNKWFAVVTIDKEDFKSTYRCDITKSQFLAFDEVIQKYNDLGPIPIQADITYSHVFDVSRCDSTSDIYFAEFISEEIAKAKINELYYFGESIEVASRFEADVALTALNGSNLGDIRCPIDKKQYDDYMLGQKLLAKLVKNTLTENLLRYKCLSVFSAD